jgi:hypothetical protein
MCSIETINNCFREEKLMMLEGLFNYIGNTIGAGYNFFVLALPLILLFLLWRRLKEMREEGFLPTFIAAVIIIGSSIGLSVYYCLYNDGNFFVGFLISFIGVALWSYVERKFTSKYYNSDDN